MPCLTVLPKPPDAGKPALKRKVKFLALLALASAVIFPALRAQELDVDAIYLKNGSIYRGILQDTTETGKIVIETLCANTLLFGRDEIDHISRETVLAGTDGLYVPAKRSGYFNRTDLGALIASGYNDKNVIFSLQMVNGYRFRNRLYPGLGTGIEFYQQAYVPLFADISYFFRLRFLSTFIRGSFGYAVPLEDPEESWGLSIDNHGGFMCTLGLGTTVRISRDNALAISLAYRFQSHRSVQTTDWNNERSTFNTQYNRIAVRIGFVFD